MLESGKPGYLEPAFSFFLAFFSLTVSLGLLVVLDFSWPLGILQNSLRKPTWRAASNYSFARVSGRPENCLAASSARQLFCEPGERPRGRPKPSVFDVTDHGVSRSAFGVRGREPSALRGAWLDCDRPQSSARFGNPIAHPPVWF